MDTAVEGKGLLPPSATENRELKPADATFPFSPNLSFCYFTLFSHTISGQQLCFWSDQTSDVLYLNNLYHTKSWKLHFFRVLANSNLPKQCILKLRFKERAGFWVNELWKCKLTSLCVIKKEQMLILEASSVAIFPQNFNPLHEGNMWWHFTNVWTAISKKLEVHWIKCISNKMYREKVFYRSYC